MHLLTISVPDEKYELFMEKMSELRLAPIETREEDFEIPEWHKEIVLQRIEESKKNPDKLIPLTELNAQFELRNGI